MGGVFLFSFLRGSVFMTVSSRAETCVEVLGEEAFDETGRIALEVVGHSAEVWSVLRK